MEFVDEPQGVTESAAQVLDEEDQAGGVELHEVLGAGGFVVAADVVKAGHLHFGEWGAVRGGVRLVQCGSLVRGG